MLALTRKTNQGIIINGDIEVKILEILDGKVKIGIEAPKNVAIHRKEVYLQIQEDNKKSVHTKEDSLDVLKGFI